MFALIGGSVVVRIIIQQTGVQVARKTNSTGCGCLVAILVLILIAVIMF